MTDTINKERYSDAELEEFRTLILAKLDKATEEYEELRSLVVNDADNGDSDTAPTFKALEEGVPWCVSTTRHTASAVSLAS